MWPFYSQYMVSYRGLICTDVKILNHILQQDCSQSMSAQFNSNELYKIHKYVSVNRLIPLSSAISFLSYLHEVVTSNVADWCIGCYSVRFGITDSGTDERRQHQIGTDSTGLLSSSNLCFYQWMIQLRHDPRETWRKTIHAVLKQLRQKMFKKKQRKDIQWNMSMDEMMYCSYITQPEGLESTNHLRTSAATWRIELTEYNLLHITFKNSWIKPWPKLPPQSNTLVHSSVKSLQKIASQSVYNLLSNLANKETHRHG